MGCFSCGSSTSRRRSSPTGTPTSSPQHPGTKMPKQEVLLQIPVCTVHVVEGGEAVELATGEFTVRRICEDNLSLAIFIKVGNDLQWPLTKDEPVVRLSPLQYLFSLPVKDGDPLSYGLTFHEQYEGSLNSLDKLLETYSCFSSPMSSDTSPNKNINWKEFAPRIEDYNNVLAKAIAGGTGHIVKGIFRLSNAYSNQVHRGGDTIIKHAAESKYGGPSQHQESHTDTNREAKKNSAVNRTMKRVRKVSSTTEKLSKTLLDGVNLVSGSVMAPLVKSHAGKSLLSMLPGEVLLASLDAVNKVMDAAEAAEKQAFSATSKAATRVVSDRFGESAGEATEDAFATAGHFASTAWNVFKIRKAINPASSVPTRVLTNAAKAKGKART